MGDNSDSNRNLDVVLNVSNDATKKCDESSIEDYVPLLQKLVAEVVGTFFLIFVGCGSVVVNLNNDNVVTLPGIAIVWGLAVVVLVYSLGHISGAHFNPAVTIAHASTKRFPLMQVPSYIIAQLIGSILASGALKIIFSDKENHFVGTLPAGSNLQAFVVEFIITFYLMFIISGVATDNRAIGELAGLAVGSTIIICVLFAGPITGASMNPARSLGPAIVHHEYRGIWIYLVSPTLGALAGTHAYAFIRFTSKPVRELTKSSSFLKGSGSK
ncbi:nodulin-26-like [Vicia villosa]|uniref:nodulin-26-like n=1 Tax=Vicia villosa TaxID=3911 RepID=UPI00273CEED2|nr:nodulin-26-like [Vicia villosa]XP_058773419.1 nodulin-26-like [Vicia villosa]XP_058773425.1 nodulin-26-like [Vicia villosa]XP_058773427.1 nodulin-26-like [Vicia villosa]XP_058773428.1 nodulin-26-like [Vicia villosa]XP_058773429.1 nodulin-26-like [Vicia villosa]